MSNNEIIFKKLPGVLSFNRGIVIPDVEFYNEDAQGNRTPVTVIRHGNRGTQNLVDGAENVTQVQITDSAKLDPDAVCMIAEMQLKFLDLDGALSACAPSASDNRDDIRNLRTSVDDFIARAKTSDGLLAVACRYARNIANGRWLWRNRTLASSIEITVYSHDVEVAKFDALSVPMRHFNDVSEGELAVGKLIRDGLIGASYSAIRIEARVDFGVRGSIEVFPSQNYLEKKTTGFARSLYCLGHAEVEDPTAIRIMGRAAMRDQKVANALRTIDTWYPQYAVLGKPIPVEPNGASLDAAEFFREKKTSSFDMVRRLNSIDPSSDEGMFVIANLIRGGVYSEGSPPDTSVKPKKRG